MHNHTSMDPNPSTTNVAVSLTDQFVVHSIWLATMAIIWTVLIQQQHVHFVYCTILSATCEPSIMDYNLLDSARPEQLTVNKSTQSNICGYFIKPSSKYTFIEL